MTEYKERTKRKGAKSLYLGLLINIIVGCLLAVLIFFAISIPAEYIIDEYFVTVSKQSERRRSYMDSLDSFIQNKKTTISTIYDVEDWVSNNPYVFIMIYKGDIRTETTSYVPMDRIHRPAEKDKVLELTGSRIDESLDRVHLSNAALQNLYEMKLYDGKTKVVVAICEYTENLYHTTFNVIGVVLAVFAFIFWLLRYIGVLIKRIKRFESDVTIVSDFDMNYEIVSEGVDEIAKLSANVEKMRRTMLDHVKSEQEAREANTELITSISHDIRTPLTVLMGYIEMMKEQAGDDGIMRSYIDATESTALRLKNLSDDMFKYSLAFGDTKKSVKLDDYDCIMLSEQLFSEHFLLMRENGYDIRLEVTGDELKEGTTVRTDAPNLMRIVDNIFSNLRKYADKSDPIMFTIHAEGRSMLVECRNKIRTDTEGAESNGIGLKTCVRLGSLVAKKFEYKSEGEYFACRLVLDIKPPIEREEEK